MGQPFLFTGDAHAVNLRMFQEIECEEEVLGTLRDETKFQVHREATGGAEDELAQRSASLTHERAVEQSLPAEMFEDVLLRDTEQHDVAAATERLLVSSAGGVRA